MGFLIPLVAHTEVKLPNIRTVKKTMRILLKVNITGYGIEVPGTYKKWKWFCNSNIIDPSIIPDKDPRLDIKSPINKKIFWIFFGLSPIDNIVLSSSDLSKNIINKEPIKLNKEIIMTNENIK